MRNKKIIWSNKTYFTEVTRKHMAFPFCLWCRNQTRLVNQVSQPYAFLHKNFTQVYYLNRFLRTSSITEGIQPESTIMRRDSFGRGVVGENSLKQRRRISNLLWKQENTQ